MANQYRSVLASSGPAPTGGDALPAEVLSGKTFTNDNGAQTGTMVNRGAVSGKASLSQPYTIPAGYHNGNGIVNANIAIKGKYITSFPFESGNMKNNFTGSYGYGYIGVFDVSSLSSASYQQTTALSSNQLSIFKLNSDGTISSEEGSLTANTNKVIDLTGVDVLIIATHTQQSAINYTLAFT